jgi:hypothetical protein
LIVSRSPDESETINQDLIGFPLAAWRSGSWKNARPQAENLEVFHDTFPKQRESKMF